MRRILGVYIFLQEMVKNLVLILQGEFGWGYLPFHLCGINILLILFDTIKQTKPVRSFLYFFAIPGAALALLEAQGGLYTGDSFLLAATLEDRKLFCSELLGDEEAAAGILAALGAAEGQFRAPGGDTPFAMFLPLGENVQPPTYFGLALD